MMKYTSAMILLAATAATVGATSMGPKHIPPLDPAEQHRQDVAKKAKFDVANKNMNSGAVKHITDIAPLSEEEIDQLNEPTPTGKPMLVGFTRPVNGPTFAPGQFGRSGTMCVHVDGAAAIRLHLATADMSAGEEVVLFNPSSVEKGIFTYGQESSQDEVGMWTHSVAVDGDEEVCLQGNPREMPKILELGFVASTPSQGNHLLRRKLLQYCSYNEPCVQLAGCTESTEHPPMSDAYTKAVAHIRFISGAYIYICSGGLLNNDATKPLFLTANHCVSHRQEADSLETYFGYYPDCETTGCYLSRSPDTIGSSILAKSTSSDFTLLELNQMPPGGTLLGWNDSEVYNVHQAILHRISHPKGAPQAYSRHEVDVSPGACNVWPRGPWIYSRDDFGATEGGSSGAPVVNGNEEVVGQLSGACGYNVDDACDSVNNWTVDGAFAAYYSQIEPFLKSGGCDSAQDCDDGNLCTDNVCDNGACTNPPKSCLAGQECDSNTGDCVESGGTCPNISCKNWKDCDSSCSGCVGKGLEKKCVA